MDGSGVAQSLRILLVTPLESVRDEVLGALEATPAEPKVFWVSQANLAVGRAQEVMPHVILVDSELDHTDPVRLIRQMARQVPGSAIIAMVEWDAMAKASQAVLSGAKAFIVKPLEPGELANTIRQVLAQDTAAPEEEPVPTEGRSGQVVVFCAPKGGTGRTTLAINSCLSLCTAMDQRVALIDADYAAPAVDVALNLQADHTIVDVLPHLAKLDRDLLWGILEEHASGLQVMMAPPPADLGAAISLPQVEQILIVLKSMFDWVVVDLGLPMDETAFAFLDGADRIVMSVLPEMVGLRNTRLMIDQLRARGYPDHRVWLVVNRVDMKGAVTVADIQRRLRVKVRLGIPDDQPLVTHSVNRGVPVMMSHPKSNLGRGYMDLARQLMERVAMAEAPIQDEAPHHSRSSLFGRLFRSTAY